MKENVENKNQIIRHLLQIGILLQKTGDRLTREFGLPLQQFAVLNEVTERNSVNQKQIVDQLLFEKSNVSKIVNNLSTAGLIDITTSSDDARLRILNVTKKGKRLRDECMQSLIAWNAAWLDPLQENDITASVKNLSKLRSLIQ